MTWIDDLAAGWKPDDRVRPDARMRRWAETKYEVADRIKPERICEIGVRCGYAAFSMLSAVPYATYVGIDDYSGRHGGTKHAHLHALRLLRRFPYTLIHTADSHTIAHLDEFQRGTFDLVHVDGDHSYGGCMADMLLAQRSGARWMLVDDVNHIKDVRRAVDDFLASFPLPNEWILDANPGSVLVHLQ